MTSGGIYAWELMAAGQVVNVSVRGTVLVNDSIHARGLALAGVGVGYLFEPMVREAVAAGQLTWLLPAHTLTETGLFLYFPRRASQAPKLRAFIAVAQALLRQGEASG